MCCRDLTLFNWRSYLALSPAAKHVLTAKISIIEALAEEFGRPIDLVDLYPAPEPLLGQVLRHGRRIIGSDEAFGRLLYRHLIAQADFMPIKNRILQERYIASIAVKIQQP
jgi:hypothetical protein